MSILVTSDWHLTDNPKDDYRWNIFNACARWIEAQKISTPQIYMLGDLTDRKDRHSAALVNRVEDEFARLLALGASISVLKGNHDQPLNGPPFWSILDYIRPGSDPSSGINFYTSKHGNQTTGLLLLPYSDNPEADWDNIDWKKYKAAFIHQTVTGAVGNNGVGLENPKMIKMPKHLRVYSGDIHTTQTVDNIFYIGAPHPINFGDSYPPQMVELTDDFKVSRVITLNTIQKLMLRISDLDELDAVKTSPRDQARVVFTIPISALDQWAAIQDHIVAWARTAEVELFSVEAQIENDALGEATNIANPNLPHMSESTPAHVLRLFAESEAIDERMLQTGEELLKEVMG